MLEWVPLTTSSPHFFGAQETPRDPATTQLRRATGRPRGDDLQDPRLVAGWVSIGESHGNLV